MRMCVLGILILGLTACSSSPAPSPTQPPTPFRASPSPIIAASPYVAIFSDSLNTDTKNGWPTGPNKANTASYTFESGYTIKVLSPKTQVLPHPTLLKKDVASYENVSISVSATPLASNSASDYYGVYCRKTPSSFSAYMFVISRDSSKSPQTVHWNIYRDGDVASAHSLAHGTSNTKKSTHLISATCLTNSSHQADLTLHLDGTTLGHAVDPTSPLITGFAGLRVESDKGNTSVTFHEFVVRAVLPN